MEECRIEFAAQQKAALRIPSKRFPRITSISPKRQEALTHHGQLQCSGSNKALESLTTDMLTQQRLRWDG
jgi:hypothetical protein